MYEGACSCVRCIERYPGVNKLCLHVKRQHMSGGGVSVCCNQHVVMLVVWGSRHQELRWLVLPARPHLSFKGSCQCAWQEQQSVPWGQAVLVSRLGSSCRRCTYTLISSAALMPHPLGML